ncbi:MAG: DNA polymerase IV [uncultured Corynebacteriales bacterium]|uniref:DNA polymerase IV n=1 Tax=uncultured Mycobacteriales bacterium TaxID=581187 RepID=A0A6J4HZW3_9ACTN|nr:MAG: DNA polymerase IV [uncultured Corynebacteriales bacterium]
MSGGPTILHADLDAFYASVEQLLDPALRGRPIAVGGSAGGGVVLAASYEAKAFGVRGGMPGRQARQLCPRLTFVRGHFGEYQRLADDVMDILHSVTPAVERISIDEAFLDVSGSTHLFGSPAGIGARLRHQVRREVGLPISIGAARTKHLAKVASQVAKPDGLVVVDPEREREFLAPLPVGLMWGVGPVAERRLAERGIRTIGDLAGTPSAALERLLGHAAGAKLAALALNEDPRRIATSRRARSVGAQSALGRRRPTPELVHQTLGHLADRVGGRLRAHARAGRTVTVRVRFAGMAAVTRSLTLPAPVSATLTLTEVAEQLAWQALADHDGADISLLAISVSNLAAQQHVQLELTVPPGDPRSPGSPAGSARWALDHSMDAVRARFGRAAVTYLSTARAPGAPDAFRELAERDL